jgi:protein arginine kinase activator
MLCDVCKKKQATVHLTEIVNDEVTELHLCEECAKSKGAQMQQHFSIADLLSGLVDFPLEASKRKEHIKLKCPKCGMKYSDFKKLGRFGCANCYDVFKRALYPLLRKIHGSAHHLGKQPKEMPVKTVKSTKARPKPEERADRLKELKKRLEKAIELEEFEEAAALRDKIKELEAEARD